MSLAARYKRWRHGRGFGVHSPYAYRMVTDVLRLPRTYAYYDYAEIARARVRLEAPISLAEALLIYRLAVEFAPSEVTVTAHGPAARLIHAIVSLVPRGTGAPMLIALDEPAAPPAEGTDAYLAYGGMKALPERLPYGHIYRNPHRAVIAARPHLPFQTMEISF